MGVFGESGTGYSSTAPAEKQLVLKRQGYTPSAGARMIVYCHSATGNALEPIGYGAGAMSGFYLFSALVEAGYMMVAADLGGTNTWAIDTVIGTSGRIKDAIAYGRAHGGKTGKYALVCSSMGNDNGMSYARANPTEMNGILGLGPAVDLLDFVTNNRAGLAAAINATCTGGAYSDSRDGPTRSPVKFASQLAAIPGQIWTSTQDTVVISSTVDTLVAGWGSACDYHKAAQGDHGSEQEFAWILSNLPTVLAFLDGLDWSH